jgi:hypothetical protein
LAHNYQALGIRKDLDPIDPLLHWAHSHVGGVDLRVRLISFEDGEIQHAPGKLDLNATVAQIGNPGLRLLIEAQDVCMIQLDFGPGPLTGGNLVALNNGRVDCRGYPIPRISTHGGDVTVNQANPPDTWFWFVSLHG